ncbi:DUF805 domain-containing protein [Stenotrophomonas sp. ESTM1D_MKCIP4_1]|uniref:DUF805 domain-containing protein n=1 Tax=Stenotrophomonas sp. ESTM1D_MKCIP4_1 TaxID=2072414 RepID=UPI000D53C689|nr:DUF805 domain-containing protein [Stenotrophomonas sp. ESTM1D_MKCIP4_1]AWH53835.1 DUF805 domain-containing protein [Stenotrophomonas sp. ESTM1D_MKCIP4_1]
MPPPFEPLRRYFDFSGRCDRTEFWSYLLFVFAVFAACHALIELPQGEHAYTLRVIGNLLGMTATVFLFIPTLAAIVRRLHDIDESGWYAVIAFIPLGVFVLFPVMLLPGTGDDNRFGQERRHA